MKAAFKLVHTTSLNRFVKPTFQKAWHSKLYNSILEDHNNVRALFDKYRQSKSAQERQNLCFDITKLLSTHSSAEEQVVYPEIQKTTNNGKELVQHSLEEHQTLKELLYQLDNIRVDDPSYDSLVQKLFQNFEHHIKKEETNIIPEFERAVGSNMEYLDKLASSFETAKKMAPTRPHPGAPAQYPYNIANVAATPIDKLRDAAREATEKK